MVLKQDVNYVNLDSSLLTVPHVKSVTQDSIPLVQEQVIVSSVVVVVKPILPEPRVYLV